MSFIQTPKLLKSDHLSFTPQTSKKDQKFINFLDDYINYMNTTSTKKKESDGEREEGGGRTDEGWKLREENRIEGKRLKRRSKEDEEKVEGEGMLEEGGEKEDEEEYFEEEREEECEEERVEEGLAEDVAFLRAAALKYRKGWEKERERRSQLEEKCEEGRRNDRIIQIKLMRKDQQIIDLQQEICKLKETVNLARKLLVREKIEKEKKKFTIQKLLIERKAFKSQNYYHICPPNEDSANVNNSSFENDNTDVKMSRPKKRDKFYTSFHQPKQSLDMSSNNNLNLASSEMEQKRNPQIYFTPKLNKGQVACDKLQKSIKNIKNNQTLIEKLAGKKFQKKLV